MTLTDIESRFLEITGLAQDLSIYPINELVHFPIRKDLSKSHGEVFTPISLVDQMLETSRPEPIKFNLDLCAGRGQFTVRMLRRFTHFNPQFQHKEYLEAFHWFNEINEDSCKELLYIFGSNINLAIGPAQELNTFPEENGVWKKGLWKYCDSRKSWFSVEKDLQLPPLARTISLF
jgi:hypothetical protein